MLQVVRQVDVDPAFSVHDEIPQAQLDQVFPSDRDLTPEELVLFADLFSERGEAKPASARYAAFSEFYRRLEANQAQTVGVTAGAESPAGSPT